MLGNYNVELIRQSGMERKQTSGLEDVAVLSVCVFVCVMALSQEVSGNVTLCRMLVSAVRARMLFVVTMLIILFFFFYWSPIMQLCKC